MKALILAAGYGTRLRPHTHIRPKPLFTIGGTTLLDRLISQLHVAGVTQVMVNTHHLADRIETHIHRTAYPLPVFTRHEPQILGTAGAIGNLNDFWDDEPFLVINGDIVTDLDIARLYRFHQTHASPVTLAVTDFPPINTVALDSSGRVVGFKGDQALTAMDDELIWRTFAGIQVLDPEVLGLIPRGAYAHSVAIYSRLTDVGQVPRAYDMGRRYWMDTGTPQRYRQAVFDALAPLAFAQAFGSPPTPGTITRRLLAGDGSDRCWYRLHYGDNSLILADHGIQAQFGASQAKSFVAIGRHLYGLGIPVPRIYQSDTCAGLVFVEDLGDLNLQTLVGRTDQRTQVKSLYQGLIDTLIILSRRGLQDFDPVWAYDTPAYDRQVVVKREGGYFVSAFLNTYLKGNYPEGFLEAEFQHLADLIETYGIWGLMHRDFQSRNIMIRDELPVWIDFQGARPGPLQYDLAALLVDPYVALSTDLQDELLGYAMDRYHQAADGDPRGFARGYQACALARSLQILGAFGFLTCVKKKRHFERYIPAALNSLTNRLSAFESNKFSHLRNVVGGLLRHSKLATLDPSANRR
ncbi:MAG: sugar phosphate nucleotidyltransferase [Desulfobacterales bacterium]